MVWDQRTLCMFMSGSNVTYLSFYMCRVRFMSLVSLLISWYSNGLMHRNSFFDS
jgi:hypothetical protein